MKTSTRLATHAAVAALLIQATASFAAIYSTPYTPGTPAIPGGVVSSYSGTHTAASPTWRRPTANGTELAPLPSTGLGGTATSLYPYHTATFTPAVSGSFDFFSAQAHDGFLFVYASPFTPGSPLINNLGGDDDMTVLNGGAVPNRNGVATANDSGIRLPLTAGTEYTIVTTTFSASVPAAGGFYNEVRSPTIPGTPATPTFPIADPPAGPTTIDLVITDPGTVVSLDSITLINTAHTWTGDLVVTLTHVESGLTVDILDRAGVTAVGGVGFSYDLAGDYTFADGAAALPTTGTLLAPGTYAPDANAGFGSSTGLAGLSSFIGTPLAGTWRLSVQDFGSGDTGNISAFSLNVTIPEPSALGLLAPAGLLLARRRRD